MHSLLTTRILLNVRKTAQIEESLFNETNNQ